MLLSRHCQKVLMPQLWKRGKTCGEAGKHRKTGTKILERQGGSEARNGAEGRVTGRNCLHPVLRPQQMSLQSCFTHSLEKKGQSQGVFLNFHGFLSGEILDKPSKVNDQIAYQGIFIYKFIRQKRNNKAIG